MLRAALAHPDGPGGVDAEVWLTVGAVQSRVVWVETGLALAVAIGP